MKLLIAAVTFAVAIGAAFALAARSSPATPPPAQPVPFSHKVHAGTNEIGCTLCHAYALHSPVAGVPSVQRCAGCHKFIDRDKPEVQKVLQAFQAGQTIAWARVYRLPDHVSFTHERHLAAGLRCQGCHGPVETMEVLSREAPLTMGWCLDCHHAKKAPADCVTCHK